ncbi:MAG TPA: polysaccharide pyruvyl transferase family protein [Vicinamibacteria bacterium]|nr:polysaccharide pyruvyl transferase family protein [Vicinamibacteria bacterium]
MAPPSMPRRFFQIANGQGAGNIGDELMNRAFWRALPEDVTLDVEVFPNATQQREPYPPRHRYVEIGWNGAPQPSPSVPGLLVGDTPVTATLGTGWPLGFLAPRLAAFHAAGLAVDALGVGVEPLGSTEARELFRRALLPVRSWTVRSERCRERLLELGVAAERVAVGADWAWLYEPATDQAAWARERLADAGHDPSRPLLVANVVNEIWSDRNDARRALASALDRVERTHGFQVAFFCNESRPGEFYDRSAAEAVRALMERPSFVVPSEYYTPDEALALLAQAAVTLSSRYHFTVQSVLAGAVPVTLARSAKMTDLLDELGGAPVGTLDRVDADAVADSIGRAWAGRDGERARLQSTQRRLAQRAARNLDLWQAD